MSHFNLTTYKIANSTAEPMSRVVSAQMGVVRTCQHLL